MLSIGLKMYLLIVIMTNEMSWDLIIFTVFFYSEVSLSLLWLTSKISFFFVWLFFSGNNDLFIDYVPPTENDSSLYVSLKQIFEPHLFPNLHNASSMVMDEFRATFEEGGYYRFTLQGKNWTSVEDSLTSIQVVCFLDFCRLCLHQRKLSMVK